jgi:hypothetical protein
MPTLPITTGKRTNMSHAIALKQNTGARKNARITVFDIEGRKASVSIPKSLFGDNVPTDLILQSDAPFAEVRAAKPKETPEERKARLAAMPKLTPEQKLAKLKERAAKLEAKLAKAAQPTA